MDLKEAFEKVTSNFLLFIIFIGIVLVIVGLKSSTVNWTFITIGAAILIPFSMYMLYTNFVTSEKLKKPSEMYEKHIREFKQSADRVIVNLDKAIIQEKNHFHTETVVEGKAAALNVIAGYGHHNEETIKSTSCDVKFTVKYNKRTITLQTTILKDETSVRMHFYLQKETIAYINPYDPKEYHIDLEFMKDA